VSETNCPLPPFDRRSGHSSRCSDRIWNEALQAAQLADCSMSVFHEVALQLLTQIVKERAIKLENYDPEARWVAEVLSRVGRKQETNPSSSLPQV
jgi:hypothetical protein